MLLLVVVHRGGVRAAGRPGRRRAGRAAPRGGGARRAEPRPGRRSRASRDRGCHVLVALATVVLAGLAWLVALVLGVLLPGLPPATLAPGCALGPRPWWSCGCGARHAPPSRARTPSPPLVGTFGENPHTLVCRDRLIPEQWRARERAHADRVDAATAEHRARRADGAKHPVEDFLFTNLRQLGDRAAALTPGAGVGLDEAAGTERASWRTTARTGASSPSTSTPTFAHRGTRVATPPPPRRDPRPAGPVRLLRAARVGHGAPPGPRRCPAPRTGRCGSDPPTPTRSSRRTCSPPARTSTCSGSSPRCPGRSTPCNPLGTSRSPSSSRVLPGTRGWTATTGRTSWCRSFLSASWSWTFRSHGPRHPGTATCAPRRTT